jgi:hypothetical protein
MLSKKHYDFKKGEFLFEADGKKKRLPENCGKPLLNLITI